MNTETRQRMHRHLAARVADRARALALREHKNPFKDPLFTLRFLSRYGHYRLRRLIVGNRPMSTSVFWGKRFWVRPGDFEAHSIILYDILFGPEHKLTHFLIDHWRAQDVFYDIGANYGFYAKLAQSFCMKGEVHAFEPNPAVFSCLKRNANATITTVNQTAVGSSVGPTRFFLKGAHSGAGTTRVSVAKQRGRHTQMQVSGTTLDHYTNTHTPPTVLKLDIEGGEQAVLKGGERLFGSKARPRSVILEMWDGKRGRAFSVPAALKLHDLGYVGHRLTETGELEKVEHPFTKEISSIDGVDNYVFCLD